MSELSVVNALISAQKEKEREITSSLAFCFKCSVSGMLAQDLKGVGGGGVRGGVHAGV